MRDDDLTTLIKMGQKNLPVIDIDAQMEEEALALERKEQWALYPVPGFKEERMEQERV